MTTEARIEVWPPAEASENEAGAGEWERESEVRILNPPESVLAHASVEAATPQEFLLGVLRDGRLKVEEPFRVTVATETEDFIAEAPEVSEFGFGKSSSEATTDLQWAIAELYFRLEQEESRLGPDLRTVLIELQRKVHRRI